MLNIRTLILSVGLMLILVITIQAVSAAGFATAPTNVGGSSFSEPRAMSECAGLPSRFSIHSEYIEETGRWVTYTEDGPTGVDDGLIHLLSAYRTCRGS